MRSEILSEVVSMLESVPLPHVTEVFPGKHVNLWDHELPAIRAFLNNERNPDIPDQMSQVKAELGTWHYRLEIIIDVAMVQGAIQEDTEVKSAEITREIKRRFANNPLLGQRCMGIHYHGTKIVTEENGSRDIYMPSLLFTALIYEDLRDNPADPLAEALNLTACPVDSIPGGNGGDA